MPPRGEKYTKPKIIGPYNNTLNPKVHFNISK